VLLLLLLHSHSNDPAASKNQTQAATKSELAKYFRAEIKQTKCRSTQRRIDAKSGEGKMIAVTLFAQLAGCGCFRPCIVWRVTCDV
jgi:hypothetical protein